MSLNILLLSVYMCVSGVPPASRFFFSFYYYYYYVTECIVYMFRAMTL